MSKLSLYIGRRVSHVVAIEEVPGYKIKCLCDCGNFTNVQGRVFFKAIQENRGLSCGCIKKKLISSARIDHGMTDSPEWKSWMSMKDRCLDKTHKSYQDYGGRGISICQEWTDDFSDFYRDMGPRPIGTTLDRKDNALGYFKENCKWSTPKEQSNNKRNSRKIEFIGHTFTLSQWAEILGIGKDTLANRLKNWTVEDAMTRQLKDQKNSRHRKSDVYRLRPKAVKTRWVDVKRIESE